MKKKLQKILFFGTEDFSLETLKTLVKNNYNVVGVITKPDTLRGRGKKLTAPAVKEFAKKHNIPVYQPDKLSQITEMIISHQPVTGVLVSFGKIIPQKIIDLFSPAIINVHPSDLPKYRGPTPIESAIINGDNKTAVSIMQLEKAMDAGGVYVKETYTLSKTENQKSLYEILGKVGAELLIKNLDDIINDTLLPKTQDHNQATYCQMLNRNQSIVDPTEKTAKQIEQKIRAHCVFPQTKIKINENYLKILEATTTNTPNAIEIDCKNNTKLFVTRLMSPNGKNITASDYKRGYTKNTAVD